MGHLTYKQRKKFLSQPFFILDLIEGLYPDQRPTALPKKFNPDFAKNGKEIYYPIHVKQTREIISENRVFTLQQVVDRLKDIVPTKEDVLRGKLKNTILYLEYEGYVCLLPDTDGELTFCNYNYFKTL